MVSLNEYTDPALIGINLEIAKNDPSSKNEVGVSLLRGIFNLNLSPITSKFSFLLSPFHRLGKQVFSDYEVIGDIALGLGDDLRTVFGSVFTWNSNRIPYKYHPCRYEAFKFKGYLI